MEPLPTPRFDPVQLDILIFSSGGRATNGFQAKQDTNSVIR